MRASGVLLVALAAVAGAGKVLKDADSKVAAQILNTLNKMSKDLKNEEKAATTAWALEKCECDNAKEDLNKSIATNSENTAAQEAIKEAAQADAGVASQQVAESKRTIKKATADINDAVAMRAKQNKAFAKRKGELTALMQTLDQAVESLANPSFVQTGNNLRGGKWMDATRKMLEDVMPMMSASEAATTESFLQRGVDVGGTGANPQMIEQISLTLQGLKKQFAAQLEDATNQENMESTTHTTWLQKTNAMKSEHESLQASAESTLERTDGEVSTANEIICHDLIAQQKEELQQKTDDCDFAERSFNTHRELRAKESAAVQQAISLFGSDTAKDLFSNMDGHNDRTRGLTTVTNTFLQIKSSIHRIYAPQNREATGSNGKIGKVVEALDKQIGSLNDTQNDDVSWRDECKELMEELKTDIATSDGEISRLEGEISTAEGVLSEAETTFQTTSETMAQLRQDMHDTETNFNQTTAEYQAAYADGTAAVSLLDKVIAALNQFYASEDRTKLKASEEGKNYQDQQEGGDGAVQMLEDLKTQVNGRLTTETNDQNTAVEDYDSYVDTSQNSLDLATGENSDAAALVAQKKSDIAELNTQLEDEQTNNTNKKAERDANFPRCSFIRKAFDQRKTHRDAEIQGLNDAKAELAKVTT